MRPLRRPTRSTIHYHGRADNDPHVTFAINGVRWVYQLTNQQCESVEHLAKHISIGKAFAFAKLHATDSRRIDLPPATTTLLRHRGAQASRAKRIKVTLPERA